METRFQNPVIVIGHGKADRLVADAFKLHYPDAMVVLFKVSKPNNKRYYIRKFFRIGMWASFSIKMLSLYLRIKRNLQRVKDRKQNDVPQRIYNVIHCHEEEVLYELTKNSNLLLFTQSIRLKDKFFQKGRSILQIVGGRFPGYCGDTAIFWAWATGNTADYCCSLIKRHKYFQRSEILFHCPVDLHGLQTLNSLRLNSMTAFSVQLPVMLSSIEKGTSSAAATAIPTFLNAPTLWTYIFVAKLDRKLKRIPAYARH